VGVPQDKQALRRYMTAERGGIPPEERAAKAEAMREHLVRAWQAGRFDRVSGEGLGMERPGAAAPGLERPQRLAGYVPFRTEADVLPMLRWCWAQRIEVSVPRVDPAAKRMTLHAIAGEEQLMPGAYGIREPAPHAPLAAAQGPGTSQVMLVPGLAFDAAGRRLGYGGGYYDRLLEPLRPALASGALQLAAVAFAAQIVDVVPTEPHDVRVRFLITEAGVRDCWPSGGETEYGFDAF
jgi:5-formyltetrahydrofolate cyclo-ligase